MNQCPSCGGFKIRGHKCPTTTITIKSMSKEEMVEEGKTQTFYAHIIIEEAERRMIEYNLLPDEVDWKSQVYG